MILKSVHQLNSSSVRQRGFLKRNNEFNFSRRASHPQSSPAINLTAFSIPVAFVICSIVSPSPCDFDLLIFCLTIGFEFPIRF